MELEGGREQGWVGGVRGGDNEIEWGRVKWIKLTVVRRELPVMENSGDEDDEDARELF